MSERRIPTSSARKSVCSLCLKKRDRERRRGNEETNAQMYGNRGGLVEKWSMRKEKRERCGIESLSTGSSRLTCLTSVQVGEQSLFSSVSKRRLQQQEQTDR